MSLPFLSRKRQEAGISGVIQKTRAPDEKPDSDESESMHSEAIKAASAELIRAVHAHDTQAVADALKDAFEILDSMPHEEGPHINETEE